MRKSPFYSPSGILSLLGLLTLLVGLVVMVGLPAIKIAAWAILALGVILMAAAAIVDFRKVSGAVTGRRGRFSTGTTVMTSIFIGITLLVNAISLGAYTRIDATGLAKFTLTSQTKDVLKKMDQPVQVICFFVPNDQYGIGTYVTNLLKEYQNYTNELTVKVIDPDANPDQAAKYGISQYQTVVFENAKGQRRLVTPNDIVQTTTDQQGNQQVTGIEAENAFTSAILEVTGVTQKKIYFTTGHGEDSPGTDYSSAGQALLDNLFQIGTTDLLIDGKVPDDASAVIIAGPKQQFDPKEITILQDYLDAGGWVMVMLNPNPGPDMGQLLAPWGLNLQPGIVVDPTSFYANNGVTSPLVPRLRDFFGFTSIYFPGATAFFPQPDYQPQVIPSSTSDAPVQIVWMSNNSTIEMFSLARSSQDSWLEKNYDQNKKYVSSNASGSLDLGFLVVLTPPLDSTGKPTGTVPPTRLVVVGDSDFASNVNFTNGDNGNFFLNLAEVLTAGKQLITIQRKVLPFRTLVVTPDVENFIKVSSIGLLPVLVLLMGGIIWWRRR